MKIVQLFKSEFVQNVSKLTSGSVLGQLIIFLASLILARVYTPKAFGLLAIYTSISGLLAIVATGRYALAIVIPKEEKEAKDLFFLSITFSICVSLLSLIIVTFFGEAIVTYYEEPKLASWLYLIPLTVFFTGTYDAFNYWSIRNKKINDLTLIKIIEPIGGSITKIIVGFQHIMGGLIVGNLVGKFISIALFTGKNIKQLLNYKIRFLTFKVQGEKYSDFLKINSLHAFMDMIKDMLFILLLTKGHGAVLVGVYAFSMRFLRMPVGIIGTSFSHVLYQNLSNKKSEGKNIKKQVYKSIRLLIIIGSVIFSTIAMLGEFTFSFVFGEAWVLSGQYAQLLSVMMFFHFISSPLSTIPLVLNQQKKHFIITLVGYIFILTGLFISSIFELSFTNTLIIYSILQSCLNITLVIWFYQLIRKS